MQWFREDNIETRNDVRRGYLYVLIQSIALYAGLFILILMIPARALPDSYTDSMGNKYEFPPSRKEDMKMFALYFVGVVGLLICLLQWYLYRVVRDWAKKDNVITYVKEMRA